MLHRLVMGAILDGVVVRHAAVDGVTDYCNLRKSRLVTGTRKQKQGTQDEKVSRFNGVTWNKQRKKWQVTLRQRRQRRHLGSFDCEIEAARVFNKKARYLNDYYSGHFRLNVIPAQTTPHGDSAYGLVGPRSAQDRLKVGSRSAQAARNRGNWWRVED